MPEVVHCECGCNNTLPKFDSRGRRRHYIRNHDKRNKFRTYNGVCLQCNQSYPSSGPNRGCKGMCSSCYHKKKRAWLRGKDPEKERTRARNRSRTQRLKILERLGFKCKCCGESIREFLALDHINGGGGFHRRTKPGQAYLEVLSLPLEEVVKKYRLLCHNCNMAIGLYGYCPHETTLRDTCPDKV